MAASTTTADFIPESAQPTADENFLTAPDRGLLAWLSTLDHKRIGIMYLICVLTSFALGGVFALIIRAQLISPDGTLVDADTYNQLFTMHGAAMVFLVIIPGIPAALGNIILPLQLGAKDVAFPRLNLFSWYLWVFGLIFVLISLFTSAADTGWTFYVPYSTDTTTKVIPVLMGAFVLGFSSIFTGLNFIVTIHKMRPPGMTWFKMPLFLWALYSTALIQVLATPVLGITLLLLIVERAFGIGIFDPSLGGDPVLFEHFFWFYSHPAVYIMIVPAFGVISEIIPTFSRKRIFGYEFIALSSVAIAILGFLVWGHHLFVSTQSVLAGTIFSAITFLIAIPTAIKVFNWVSTMYKGRIHLETPMLYALAFLWVFTIGGLTGVFLGVMSVDVHLHDTYFVVAHFHYVMMGGAVTAFFGGLHYWWPKIFGRMYNERWAKIATCIVFIGVNGTFFPQFVMGSRGMPRRYWHYLEEFQVWHVLSSIGALILGIGFIITAIYLAASLFKKMDAPRNPWGSAALEWKTTSPPPYYNFHTPPVVADHPYHYENLTYDPALKGYREIDPHAEESQRAAQVGES